MRPCGVVGVQVAVAESGCEFLGGNILVTALRWLRRCDDCVAAVAQSLRWLDWAFTGRNKVVHTQQQDGQAWEDGHPEEGSTKAKRDAMGRWQSRGW